MWRGYYRRARNLKRPPRRSSTLWWCAARCGRTADVAGNRSVHGRCDRVDRRPATVPIVDGNVQRVPRCTPMMPSQPPGRPCSEPGNEPRRWSKPVRGRPCSTKA